MPDPGLRPFQADEAEVFFGRDEQVDQLLNGSGESTFPQNHSATTAKKAIR